MSETDDHGSVSTTRKGKNGRRRLDGAVNETEEGSDGDMEEAGGMDE
jgi:AMP deaminase